MDSWLFWVCLCEIQLLGISGSLLAYELKMSALTPDRKAESVE